MKDAFGVELFSSVLLSLFGLYRSQPSHCCPKRTFVASTGIEPVSGASETLILSIVLRGRFIWPLFDQAMGITGKYFYRNGQQNYAKKFTNC